MTAEFYPGPLSRLHHQHLPLKCSVCDRGFHYTPSRAPGRPGLVDTRADLWALSMLLLWMCEGSPLGHLPESLFTALRRSTARSPAERHPDVATWLADVENALAPPAPPAGPPAATAAGQRCLPFSSQHGFRSREFVGGNPSPPPPSLQLTYSVGGSERPSS